MSEVDDVQPQIDREQVDLAEVGARLKRARQAAGYSMAELARRSGVSQPFISQVERGLFAPSLITLYRLAGGLGIAANTLLPSAADESSSWMRVVRAGHGVPFAMSDEAGSPIARVLSRADAAIEAAHFSVDAGTVDDAWFEHPGEDFVYVLSGSLEVEVRPEPPVMLGPGDSVHYVAATPHTWRVAGPDPVELILVVVHSGPAGSVDPHHPVGNGR